MEIEVPGGQTFTTAYVFALLFAAVLIGLTGLSLALMEERGSARRRGLAVFGAGGSLIFLAGAFLSRYATDTPPADLNWPAWLLICGVISMALISTIIWLTDVLNRPNTPVNQQLSTTSF